MTEYNATQNSPVPSFFYYKNNFFSCFRTMGPVYMDHYPAGSSTRAFVHFAQIFNNRGDFVKYDYGDPEEV